MRGLGNAWLRSALIAGTALFLALGEARATDRKTGEGRPPIAALSVVSPQPTLRPGETIQLSVLASFADGSSRDVAADSWVRYQVFPAQVLTVNPTGQVTALAVGDARVVIDYGDISDFLSTSVRIMVRSSGDRDGDGLSDELESRHGLDPDFALDAEADLDQDGLTNAREIGLGTDLTKADTDRDFAPDGLEVARGTDPLVPESQEDGGGPRLSQDCTVSALNRSARVQSDGTWVLPNVPADQGQVRMRATCIEGGNARSGQSGFFDMLPNGAVRVDQIRFDAPVVIPVTVSLTAPQTTLTAVGQTTQLTATAALPGGSTRDITPGAAGTGYLSSNPAVATVSPNGLVTALVSGTVLVSALNDGALGVLQLRILLSGDSDGDGLADDFELANGLDPNNPVDVLDDPDGDGLSTKDEFLAGLDPRDPDTDDDDLADGREAETGTNPLLFDTDGDQFSDGLEVATGSNPLDPNSYNLAATLQGIEVSPDFFILNYNTLLPEASVQLTVTGTLRDGTRIDLTSAARGTTYTSSDLTTCNFGSKSGEVFAGQSGTCIVRVACAGARTQAEIRVAAFSPTGVATLPLPGHANAVDVQGDFAYVASGGAGLVVVDVTDRHQPVIAATHDTPGNANDVKLSGSLALVSDGSAGLVIVDVTNPRQPVRRAVLDTPGDARDVALQGTVAFLADGPGGLRLIDVSSPQSPRLLSTLALPGEANGVEVDAQAGLAVVAAGDAGIHVVDVKNLSAPRLLGSLDTGDAHDVALVPGFAFVADAEGGFTSVDLSDPAHPVVRSVTPRSTGGLLVDVALVGRFAFGADFFFYNGSPILDVSSPAAPLPRAILDFTPVTSIDHDGFGVAADRYYLYRAGGYGHDYDAYGQTLLYIGQYLAIDDSDQDGIPDDYERANGLDPQNPNDADEDPDGDDLTNLDEFLAGTSPHLADTDGDGLSDWIEIYARNTDPLRADTDGDGLNDSDELNRATDPRKPDTDGDGLTDGYEVANGSDPLKTDTDGDGLTDGAEAARGTNPANPDTDGDGARDGYEVALACDPLRVDITQVAGRALRSGTPFSGAKAEVLGRPGVSSLTGADGRFLVTGILACPPATRASVSAQDGNVRLRGLSSTLSAVLGGTTDVGDILLSVVERPLYPQPLTFAGYSPIDAVAGDFNRDNVVDIAVADRDPDRVRILLGNGNGSFQPEVEYRVGPDPTSVAIADFDRDGIQDLVTANSGHFSNDTVSILLGIGDGRFRTETRISVGFGTESVTTADLNGDGIADILTADTFTNTISVLTGRGDGTFLARTTLSPGGSPRTVAIADLLGDGVPDVLTLVSHNVVVIFRGTTTQVKSFATGGNSPLALTLGDFNHDGRKDVATVNYGTIDASVLLADGAGGFLPALRLPLGRKPWAVTAGDVDSDGDDDLLATVAEVGSYVGDRAGEMIVFLSRGDGTFQDGRAFRAGLMPEAVVLTDLESDGVLDAAVADFFGQELFVLLGEGDGTFWAPRTAPVGDQPDSAVVADFNGDGAADLAVANVLTADISVLLRNADGTFQTQRRVSAGSYPSSLVAADINGDHVADLAETASGALVWRIGQGDGTFQAVRTVANSGDHVAAGDLDRDGRADLVTAKAGSDQVAVFLANADGSLRAPLLLPAGDAPVYVRIVDVNGDDRLDLLAVNRLSNDVSLLLGNGDGTFGVQRRMAVGVAPGWLAAGDLDRDGALDLVVGSDSQSSNNYELSILMGNGDGTFDPERRLPYGDLPLFGAVTDADGDGIPDLLIASYGFSVLSGKGDGTFQAPKVFSALGWVQAVADVDGNGQPDVVVTSDSRDEVIVLTHR